MDPFLELNEEHSTFHVRYEHSGTFADRKYEQLSYPQKSENVLSHSSNSIEKATQLQSIQSWRSDPIQQDIPLASYKEVPPPPDRNADQASL